MLNPREMAEHAALCSERGRCILLLSACAGAAMGFAALTFIFKHGECWVPLAAIGVTDLLITSAVLARLGRISRRLENLERFL